MKVKTALCTSLLLLCLSSYQSEVYAWVEPVDMNADIKVSGDVYNTSATYHRCDTDPSNYDGITNVLPSICHRWGLVFEYSSNTTDWTPKVDGNAYRLPTIKELVRLFNYTDGTGLDSLIKNMLETVDENTWLISSSYRDIDGTYDAGSNGQGRLQIFALNALTGEVKTFEPGQKSSGNARLELCVSLASDGDCTLDSTSTIIHALKVKQTLLKDL